MSKETIFSSGDLVVYPAHGVGRLEAIEAQKVAGHELTVFVITFEKDRMTLRLPMAKAKASGLRPLSSETEINQAFATLEKSSKVKKGLWSRRAQEYELKINSGKLSLIAEVIRDLHRGDNQSDQSYSERQIYKAALERLSSEISAAHAINEDEVVGRVEASLCKRTSNAA
ncbi:MAG: CarD family transcriptional regulator [Candidatus Nucleicultricaceae bacterium]